MTRSTQCMLNKLIISVLIRLQSFCNDSSADNVSWENKEKGKGSLSNMATSKGSLSNMATSNIAKIALYRPIKRTEQLSVILTIAATNLHTTQCTTRWPSQYCLNKREAARKMLRRTLLFCQNSMRVQIKREVALNTGWTQTIKRWISTVPRTRNLRRM